MKLVNHFAERALSKLQKAGIDATQRRRQARWRDVYDIHPSFSFQGSSRAIGDGHIRLGAGSYVNDGTWLVARGNTTLTIGEGCRIGQNIRIETRSIDPDADLSGLTPAKEGDVTIGDWVWIGMGTYIGPGITIGANAVVGANSVVTRDVEPFEIVGGVPIRHIRYKASRP
jgi:maltose O-acetyltransferase